MSTTSQRKKKSRPKHIPQRTCIGCRETRPKRELVRIVRNTSGAVEVDPTGKKSGRGAYLCKAKGCWEAALKKERLDRALRMKIAQENRKELAQYVEMLP
ncbi:MAG: YlxR family protein [Dehalococcoidia bacterium]|nr:MAG: YlxR family protein [Dehalococcoidia bacterium]